MIKFHGRFHDGSIQFCKGLAVSWDLILTIISSGDM